MADNSLPGWFLLVGGIPSVIAAWTGLILSLRREWRERPQLRFLFRATPYLQTPEDWGGHCFLDSISVTITNIGAHPISLDSITCVFRGAKNPSFQTRREVQLNHAKVERGTPELARIELQMEPTQIESVTLIDTTGKQWKPNWRERRQLRSACAEAWPKKKKKADTVPKV
jgi:hypothetical protein